jgi:hypothetical protein
LKGVLTFLTVPDLSCGLPINNRRNNAN